jgi:type I restriction enzyme S subunit
MARQSANCDFPKELFRGFPEKWGIKKLHEICKQVTDGTHDTPKKQLFGYPLIMGRHIRHGQIIFEDFDHISKEDHLEVIRRSNPEPGDILFSNIGAYLGETAIIPEGIEFSIKNVALFKPDSSVHNRFLYFYLVSPFSRDLQNRLRSGSAQPFLGLSTLRQFPVVLPPLPEQKVIAHVLGTLDDKIELNRKMNETLEAMARVIFKSWFVDFDPVRAKAKGRKPFGMDAETAALFPDSFQDSPLGKIPKGWQVVPISELGAVICGKTPPTKVDEYYGNAIPFITIPDMHGKVFVTRTGRYLSFKGAEFQEKKYLPPYSISVSCIATPGLVVLNHTKSQTNQQINSVIPKESLSPFYSYWLLKFLGDEIRMAGSGGSVFGNLSKGRFEKLKVLLADKSVIGKFHKMVEPLFHKILNNMLESETLASIRDTLLPKLLSGETRIKNPDKFLEGIE